MAEAFGPYRVGELLGRGGMGEVHRAYDTAHDRVVALKRLSAVHNDDEDFRARFRRESRIVARLREPHVIPIHAYGEIDGRLYLDMRLVEGSDLAEVVAGGPLPPDRAVRIVAQVAGALDAAHADGLLHRDVKPSNVLVTPDDFVYLVDFGIARSALPSATHLTESGAVIGTLDYLAPERIGGGPVDGRSDVYALACVLHACVTGNRPFEADSAAALLWAHLQQPPPSASATNPSVPLALDDVIRRGMAKDPAQRYPTAGALATAAARALAPTSTPASDPIPPLAPIRTPAPNPALLPPPTPTPAPRPIPTPVPHPVFRPAPPPPGRKVPTAPLVAGVIALALVAAVLVWAVDWTPGGALANSSTMTFPTTTTTTAEPTTRSTTSPTTTQRSTTTTDERATALLRQLPEVYRDNPTCAPEQPTGAGAVATVACAEANSAHFRFPPPDLAVFHLFPDRAAQDAHFQSLVQANGIPRDDDFGGCRPLTRPAHYALYYRSQSQPAPGEFTTCFVADGVGQVWWVDTRTSITGTVRSAAATDPDRLDQLGYWWNSMILTKMS
ncbi:serine/threonine-protein kinase [Saccharothrix sp. HUAS TT1]|uniref:serine/threonine-protein kinase n=1 Tax=unclassified Saccharothrix TaxID=2593673 RepID=UPI00345B89A8